MKKKGTVLRKRVAVGSKSEHNAVVIVTNRGEWILRRIGGNPFSDVELNNLVGRQIECEGTPHQQYFVMSKWKDVEEISE